MYCIRKVNDDYTWVGADCRRLALFEGVFGVPDGVSFNSYLLMDDKTVLFDTVDSAVRTTFRENVAHVLNGIAPDYLVVHHMEPDHAAEMADLARQYEANAAVKQYERYVLERRQSLLDAYAIATRHKDMEAVRATNVKIRAFNQRWP